MQSQLQIPIDKKIKAVYLFVVLHALQMGVGVVGLPRVVYEEAKQDSWVSVLIAGIALHIVIACIVFILNSYKNTDIHGILAQIFGQKISKVLSMVFIFYFYLMFISILLNYIEFVQVFIFPKLSTGFIASLLIFLVIYAVYGGVRAAVGSSIVFFFTTIWMVLLLIEPIFLMRAEYFLPVLDNSPQDIFSGALKTSYSILGFELIWVLYPFIQDKKNVAKYSHFAMLFTIILVMYVTVVAIGYFSPKHLEMKVWPLFTMFKIITLPIFERFDVISVALWLMVVIPNLILLGWMISYSCKRVTGLKQKHCLHVFMLIALIVATFVDKREYVNILTDYVGQAGIFFGLTLPFLLLPFAIYKRVKGNKS
ncbi:GerAB/ArcD/ProY family transporter [Alkalibacillus aidingensis]|uniref:GerAB/ArcD/ProY family transporter n=1 Tax=Alkalibacillus aidingensis TaxID=2747607 RepID=UPI001660D0E4|nr:GerAB/ArcD/ProY family transporter [Alkalibacillus aidingensis]